MQEMYKILCGKSANNAINSDFKKRRGFRYATASPLFEAGYGKRYVFKF